VDRARVVGRDNDTCVAMYSGVNHGITLITVVRASGTSGDLHRSRPDGPVSASPVGIFAVSTRRSVDVGCG